MSRSKRKNEQMSFFQNGSDEAEIQSVSSGDDQYLDGYANDEHYESDNMTYETEYPTLRSTDESPSMRSSGISEEEFEPLDDTVNDSEDYSQSVRLDDDAGDHEQIPEVVKESEKKPKLDFDYRNSLIIRGIFACCDALSKKFRSSALARFFTSFEPTADYFRQSKIYGGVFNEANSEKRINFQKKFRTNASGATVPSLLSRLSSILLRINLRTYGLLTLSFSVTTLLIHYLVTTRFDFFAVDRYAPITAIILTIASLFFVFSDSTLSEGIRGSAILSTLIYGFLGIKRPSLGDYEEYGVSVSACCLIGVLLGGLTLFVPAHVILALIMTMVYTIVVTRTPEMGIISLIIVLPFIYTSALLYMVIVITVSYLSKLFMGKRSLELEFPDLFVGILMVLMLLSDVFTFGNSINPPVATAFVLVYFLAIAMLRNPTWFERAVNAVILTTGILAFYGIFVTFFGRQVEILNIDFSANSDTGIIGASALSSTAILSIFLMYGAFYLLGNIFTSKIRINQVALLLLLAAVLVYIFREGSLFVCVAFSVAIIFFMLLKWNKTLLVLVICGAALPLLPIFYNGVFRGLANIFEQEAYRTDIWNAVFNMLTGYGLTGIGSSNEAFTTLYSSYYVGNTVNVPHAHSTLLQLTITLGFLGIILFALIIIFLVQSTFSYARNSIDKTSSNKTLCFSGICAVLAMVLTGIGENVLRDPRAALVFWLLCGLTVCARRSAKDISAIDEILAEIDAYYYG